MPLCDVLPICKIKDVVSHSGAGSHMFRGNVQSEFPADTKPHFPVQVKAEYPTNNKRNFQQHKVKTETKMEGLSRISPVFMFGFPVVHVLFLHLDHIAIRLQPVFVHISCIMNI